MRALFKLKNAFQSYHFVLKFLTPYLIINFPRSNISSQFPLHSFTKLKALLIKQLHENNLLFHMQHGRFHRTTIGMFRSSCKISHNLSNSQIHLRKMFLKFSIINNAIMLNQRMKSNLNMSTTTNHNFNINRK